MILCGDIHVFRCIISKNKRENVECINFYISRGEFIY